MISILDDGLSIFSSGFRLADAEIGLYDEGNNLYGLTYDEVFKARRQFTRPDATTLYDVSGKGNDGTITGAVWAQNDQGLWYLDYNGTGDNIDCGTVGINWDTDSWTVLAWGFADGNATDYRGMASNRFGAGAASWWTLGAYGDANGYLTLERTGAVTTQDVSISLDGLGWNHYALRVSGGSDMKVYFNAVLTNIDITSAEDIGDNTNDLRFGRWFSDTQGWDGGIALQKVVTSALSLEEIANHRNQTKHLFGV